MVQAKDSGCGALILVGYIGFVVGRCSVDDRVPTNSGTPTALASIDEVTETFDGAKDSLDTSAEPYRLPPADEPKATEPVPPPRQSFYAGGDSSTYYRNCSAARAAGAAPVREGDPGYGGHLDRDNDGVGCE